MIQLTEKMYLFELCPIMWVLRKVQLGVCVFTKCFVCTMFALFGRNKNNFVMSKFVFSVFKKNKSLFYAKKKNPSISR